jgi:hypothetical protein
MPAWKHSQYFLRQPDFLQLQPLLWRALAAALSSCSESQAGLQPGGQSARGDACHAGAAMGLCKAEPVGVTPRTSVTVPGSRTIPGWILGRKALGLRSRMASTAAWRTLSLSRLLQQLTQLQPSQ